MPLRALAASRVAEFANLPRCTCSITTTSTAEIFSTTTIARVVAVTAPRLPYSSRVKPIFRAAVRLPCHLCWTVRDQFFVSICSYAILTDWTALAPIPHHSGYHHHNVQNSTTSYGSKGPKCSKTASRVHSQRQLRHIDKGFEGFSCLRRRTYVVCDATKC
jgi:hypothetical protein